MENSNVEKLAFTHGLPVDMLDYFLPFTIRNSDAALLRLLQICVNLRLIYSAYPFPESQMSIKLNTIW